MNSRPGTILTPRQRREREYYDEFSDLKCPTDIDFSPIAGEETRPWNSYWRVYQFARSYFQSPSQKLLDFGCGWGTRSITLARLGYEVHGFDISPACIAVAQRLAEKYELADRVSFSVQTAENLEYASETFDIVVGTNILHHCDIAPAIGQCWRVLKRGGLALFREHMEVPIIDPLRKCRLMLWIAPRTKSFDKEITEDEHNLTSSDMKAIREVFPDISLWRFGLCDRLRTVARRYTRALQKLDYYLFKAIPPLAVFGSDVVMTLKKG